jgi:uncharacterized damage-inducible protein DinB
MELLDDLRRRFSYNAWANTEALAAIEGRMHATARPVKLMTHILSAERLWLERMTQQPQSLPVWPDFSLDWCKVQVVELDLLWRSYLQQLSPKVLSQNVEYKNTKGEPWKNAVQDILTHVLFHSTYHRGQIASQMRADGELPAFTDFIHAVRKGLID